jgi:hypothetical protein
MFRFTIRDVLWLMVVVAMGAGWWMDKRMLTAVRLHAKELRDNLTWARLLHDYQPPPPSGVPSAPLPEVDWKLTERPIP